MERHFLFDKYNTWVDWDLILTAKEIPPAEPKTNYINIDGMSGTLDLSEALTGGITYNDRTIKADFWTNVGTRTERERRVQSIIRLLHGRKIKIIEPDDPDHYFYGRVSVLEPIHILPYSTFSIEAVCEPWRYATNDSSRIVSLNGTDTADVVIRNNGMKTLCPSIVVDGDIVLTYNGVVYTLSNGVYKFSDIKLYSGANVITATGTGLLTFTYKEAEI